MARKLERIQKLNEFEEYGESFKVPYFASSEAREKALNTAILSAMAQLPINTVFEIRSKVDPKPPESGNNLDRITYYHKQIDEWVIAWYCVTGEAANQGGFGHDPTKVVPLFKNTIENRVLDEVGGYSLVARLKVVEQTHG